MVEIHGNRSNAFENSLVFFTETTSVVKAYDAQVNKRVIKSCGSRKVTSESLSVFKDMGGDFAEDRVIVLQALLQMLQVVAEDINSC